MGDSERISTTSLLNNICEENVSDDIRIGDLLNSLNEGGFALMNMLCAIILMIPTPPPIAIIMGLVIMFFSAQVFCGKKNVWLPQYIANKSIPRHILAVAISKSVTYLYKLEKLTHRRFFFMLNEKVNKITFIFMFVLAFVTLSPLPFCNTIPGVAIVMLCFGILNKDGFVVILGYIVGIIGIFVVWYMILFGVQMFYKLVNKFFG